MKMVWHGYLSTSKKRTVLFISILGITCLFLLITSYGPYYARRYAQLKDAEMTWAWEGFGPERGDYNFTLVTAMLDIGRGSWKKQTRNFNIYLMHMQRVLRLDVNMVIFVDRKAEPFVRWMRRGRENRTRIEMLSVSDVPYYRFRGRMHEIMASREYMENNELVACGLAESVYPEYDIVQLSKLYFIDWAVDRNFFKTSFFMWLDAGYGHGKNIHPADGIWFLKNIYEFPKQITFLNRSPGVLALQSKKDFLHKISVNVMPGGFFAGTGETFKIFYRLQQEELNRWMQVGIVDDDQTMNMLIYYENPSLFHLVSGNWNDVFKLFNSHKS